MLRRLTGDETRFGGGESPAQPKQAALEQPASQRSAAAGIAAHGSQDVTFRCFLGARVLPLQKLSFVPSFNKFSVKDCSWNCSQTPIQAQKWRLRRQTAWLSVFSTVCVCCRTSRNLHYATLFAREWLCTKDDFCRHVNAPWA